MSGRRLAAVPDRPQRVVLYVRVSALMGRGGEDFHSPELQTGMMRRQTAGMREVEVIEDIDQSGRTFSREGIEKIRKLAQAGAIDAVAVYNVSRLGRNVLESLQFLAWLAERGVTILSATEQINTSTPSGKWLLTNMLAIAEMRSDEIAAGWSQVIGKRAENGRHHGRVPTGYLRGDDGRLVPDPASAPAVRQAMIDYAAGDVVREIRRRLQTATGLVIAASTFKDLLRNPAYRGTVRVKARGPAGAVEKTGAHEALVDEPTWARVQARIARDSRMPAKLVDPKYSLSGLLRCGTCGGRTNCRPDTKKRGRVRIACVKAVDLMGDCVGCGSANLAGVEAEALARTVEYVAALRGDVSAAAAQVARSRRAGVDADAVRAELAATRRAMARTTERWAREQIDDRTYSDTMESLRATEAQLGAAKAELEETAAVQDPDQLAELGERMIRLWPKMSGTERNQALRELVESVTVARSAYYRQPVVERVTVQFR